MAAMPAPPIVTILDRWPDEELPQRRTKPAVVEEPSLMNTRTIVMVIIMLIADFELITRSRTMPGSVENRSDLESVAVDLLRLAFPLEKTVRLLGVSVSGFVGDDAPDHPRQIALEL